MLVANGQSKPIDQIKVGDQVVATDPASGATSTQPVNQVIIGEGAKRIVDVRVQSPQGTSLLRATDNHPFWVANAPGWLDAADLRPGMTLRTSDGTQAAVVGTEVHHRQAKVYNLTVADVSTFYALAGDTPVLVHNSDCCYISPEILEEVRQDGKYVRAVMAGVEWNIKRYNEGATSHALNNIGLDEFELAAYLARWEKVWFLRTDKETGNFVEYDLTSEVLLVKHPGGSTNGMIHAFNMPKREWDLKVDSRYEMGGEP